MVDQPTYFRRITLSALITPLCLIGGMFLGFILGISIFNALPGHMSDSSRILLAAPLALIGMLAGGAAWGAALANILGSRRYKRSSLAGAVGISLTTVIVVFILGRLEFLLVEQGKGPHLPIHRLFTLLFAPAAAVVAGAGGTAIGFGLGKGKAAIKIGAGCALIAGLAFLLVNLIMEAFGWVVGAPRAAERFTMLTVMFSGNLAAALAGGAVIGVLLGKQESMAELPDSLVSNEPY